MTSEGRREREREGERERGGWWGDSSLLTE